MIHVMIQCFTGNFLPYSSHLPAVPRIGELVSYDHNTYEVTHVRYELNEHEVYLTVRKT